MSEILAFQADLWPPVDLIPVSSSVFLQTQQL